MFDFATTSQEIPIALQQSVVFNKAMHRLGVDMSDHAFPGGAAMVLRRRIRGLGPVGVVSRGPVWIAGAGHVRVDGLVGMRRALGLRHLFVSPERGKDAEVMHEAGFCQVARAAQIAELSLAGGTDSWLRRMDQKWRNRLRHGQKQGVVVERHDFLPRKDTHWLFEADQKQQGLRNFRNLPHPLLAEMARVRPGSVQLFLARQAREPVAAMMFLRHGPMATYQIGWTTPVGKRLSAHNLLMWEAIQSLAGMGHSMLDLGILNPRKTPGIDRFKLGAGAVPRDLGGTWLQSGWAGPLHTILRAARA